MSDSTELAITHLRLRLRPINRALRHAVKERVGEKKVSAREDLSAICITEEQVKGLLQTTDSLLGGLASEKSILKLTEHEKQSEQSLLAHAKKRNVSLPLEFAKNELGLNDREQNIVLLALALELHSAYERIYSFILDDLSRRYVCPELLMLLDGEGLLACGNCRSVFLHHGKLRRLGLIEPWGNAATELRQEFRLTKNATSFLLGEYGDWENLFVDSAVIEGVADAILPMCVDAKMVEEVGKAIARKDVAVTGIWGARQSSVDEVVKSIAAYSKMPLRVLQIPVQNHHIDDVAKHVSDELKVACALHALLWIPVERLAEPENAALSEILADQLARTSVPVCLSGIYPWRPTSLLCSRPYREINVPMPDLGARIKMWTEAVPGLSANKAADLAALFRLNATEMRAASHVAQEKMKQETNSSDASAAFDKLDMASQMVVQRDTFQFATLVQPKRGPQDLIMTRELHDQVMDVPSFYRSWSRIDDDLGFGRLRSGGGGIKVLFTGESGTGKSLAAEVIAQQLKLPLLKADISKIASKWVGESEKHLDAVFREAEESQSVLLFDEADAIFGKRGDIRHGSDRFANLEVGFLLQRLEDFYGLAILTSNLRDEIDPAFIRRFQSIIHFPRPGLEERLNIWKIAFPPSAPLHSSVDFELLARLDLTGAGIVDIARTSALLAVDEKHDQITMAHIVRATARQYRREARVLSTNELGPYAQYLQALP